MTRFAWIVFALAVALLESSIAPLGAQESRPPRSPILVTFDLHMDPMGGVGNTPQGRELHARLLESADWLLSVAEPRGTKLSFSTGGEFAEFCLGDPVNSFPIIRRLHASGGSVGTHSHDYVQDAPFQWRSLGSTATAEGIAEVWSDEIGMVDRLALRAIGLDGYASVREINNLRGAHVPSDAAERHALFEAYGFEVSQAGPGEDFYGLFQHYLYHPYRPSAENELAEDRDGAFILTQAGPVLGAASIHKGIYQDMSLPKVQARFLAEVLNWIHDARTGAPDRVWSFGWAAHGTDVTEDGVSRPFVEPLLDWLEAHFIGRPVAGGVLAQYGSYMEEAAAHRAWESAHPDLAAKSYPSRDRDWSSYPWLVPVAAHLWDASYVAVLADDPRIQAHRLEAPGGLGGPYPIVVAFPAGSSGTTLDLRSVSIEPWKRVDPSTGAQTVCPADRVPVPRLGGIYIPASSCPTLDEQKALIESAYPPVVSVVSSRPSPGDGGADPDEPEPITEVTRDIPFAVTTAGTELLLDFYPATAGTGPFPLVVVVHGGGFVKGDKSTAEGLRAQPGLNARGIAVMSINYRFASEVTLEYMAADVKCAIRYARRNASLLNIDPDRIGITGSSAGGYLANLSAVANEDWDTRDYVDPHDGYSSAVQSLVDWYGATDVTEVFDGFPTSLRLSLLGSRDPSRETLEAASPAWRVDASDPPALILNGVDDAVIPMDQAQKLYDAYVAAGARAELILVENAMHGFVPTDGTESNPTRAEIIERTEEWFQETLVP